MTISKLMSVSQMLFTHLLSVLNDSRLFARKGYFVEPTLIETTDPKDRIMREEIFGPVLTAYVYKDSDVHETLKLVDNTTPFALTGAIFGQDE